jgi:hypothetical protein
VVDVFEEVDEQIRSDHYQALARRYLPWIGAILGLALVAALSWWGYSRYLATNAQKASETYARGLDSLGRGDFDGAYKAFMDAAKAPSGAYRAMGLMQAAGVRVDQGRDADAVALFDRSAAAAANPVLADAARLKAALILMDGPATYDQIEARLKPLTDSKRAYAPLAREALAMEKLQTGRLNAARNDFVVLSLMADAPDDVRQRAGVAREMIDHGGLSNLKAIIAAAKAMPVASADAEAAMGAPPGGGGQGGDAQAGGAQ